jgi:hypothetical protein
MLVTSDFHNDNSGNGQIISAPAGGSPLLSVTGVLADGHHTLNASLTTDAQVDNSRINDGSAEAMAAIGNVANQDRGLDVGIFINKRASLSLRAMVV